jgi:hypothetical protein
MNTKLGIILDNAGVIYIGQILSDTPDFYLIKDPAQVVYDMNEETKEVEVKVFPVCFPEILSAQSRVNGTKWIYKKTNARFASADDTSLDPRVVEYYISIFQQQSKANIPTA